MNFVLTGFMASGKTEISRCLAQALGYAWVDTDEQIEKKMQMPIRDIFAQYGEQYFRDLETEIIREIAQSDRTVISTGGGVVLRRENIDLLRSTGVILNLAPDFSVITDRIRDAAATRPLMNGKSIDEIEKIFNERRVFYNNCDYQIRVNNEKTAAEHAEEILNMLKGEGLLAQ